MGTQETGFTVRQLLASQAELRHWSRHCSGGQRLDGPGQAQRAFWNSARFTAAIQFHLKCPIGQLCQETGNFLYFSLGNSMYFQVSHSLEVMALCQGHRPLPRVGHLGSCVCTFLPRKTRPWRRRRNAGLAFRRCCAPMSLHLRLLICERQVAPPPQGQA